MSASSKKKLRKEQNAAILTEKQLKEQIEAKKLKLTTGIFVGIIGLVLCAFVVMITVNLITTNGVFEKATAAATFNGEKINSVEMNYYYVDAVLEEYSNLQEQYGDYASSMFSIMGLDPSQPLDEQMQDEESGKTWADYYMDIALKNAQRDYALVKAAKEAGYTLSAEDKTSLENIPNNLESYAYIYGFTSANSYLRSNYGNGADEKSYVEYVERGMIADGYYSQYNDSLTYDDAAIRAQDDMNPLKYNSYNYSYYYVSYNDYLEGGTKGEDGKTEYSDEEKDAARAKAKEIADQLALNETKDALKAAVEALEVDGKKEEKLTESKNTLYTSVSALYNEWIGAEDRKEGDITVVVNESTTGEGDEAVTVINGYYVVCYESKDTNDAAKMTSVRHLLVEFPEAEEGESEDEHEGHDHAEDEAAEGATEGTTEATEGAEGTEGTEPEATEPETEEESGSTVSDEDKKTALAKAEALLAQWKEGDATEDSFAALVEKNTDDTASAETGGLYEHVHAGSNYVEPFLNWAIDAERKAGDVEIVETEYGYHIMYFVGQEDLTYRDQMISDELRAADLDAWFTALTEANPLVKGETKYLSKDMILG